MKIMHNTGTWKAYQMSIKEKLPIKFTHNQANPLLSLRYEASRVDLKKIFILKSRSNSLQNQTMRNLGASQGAYVEQELPLEACKFEVIPHIRLLFPSICELSKVRQRLA